MLIIATLIIPFETIAVPLLLIVSRLPWLGLAGIEWGWLNSYHVQIIPFMLDGVLDLHVCAVLQDRCRLS